MRDLATGEMTWRELICYVRGLPDNSRLGRAVVGDGAAWTPDTRLLADIFDALAQANWQRAGNKHAPRPKPYPRPKDKRATAALGKRLRQLKGDK